MREHNEYKHQNKAEEQHIALTTAILISFLEVNDYFLKGGNESKEMERTRKDFEKNVIPELGPRLFRRAYRMEIKHFYKLHSILEPHLDQYFFPKNGGKRDPKKNKYLISTKMRLSIAIRFFAGGDPLDILQTHGVSLKSVYTSLWGVIDCVNKCEELQFHFPTLEEQPEIAQGFMKKSGAKFPNVIGAIDGILIWIMKPTKAECKKIKVADGLFKCWRKDKFGFNMQAICDHKLRIRWIDIRYPGNASDFMAWTTYSLCKKLDKETVLPRMLLKGMTLLGDNAYVKTKYMSIPFKYDVTQF